VRRADVKQLRRPDCREIWEKGRAYVSVPETMTKYCDDLDLIANTYCVYIQYT